VRETDQRRPRSGRLHAGGQRGSLTVELVVLAPVIALFLLVALGFGRYALAREEVVGGARAAADAVAVAGSAFQAQQAAAQAAAPVLQSNHSCVDPDVTVDPQSFAPGGVVRVSVSCHVEFSDLLIPGFPGSTTITAVEETAIDPYRSITP
jgi:Flp pilus assembly protein TadG